MHSFEDIIVIDLYFSHLKVEPAVGAALLALNYLMSELHGGLDTKPGFNSQSDLFAVQ